MTMKITAHEICNSIAQALGNPPEKAMAMHDALELITGLEGIGLTRNAQFFAATVGASMHLFDEIYDGETVGKAREHAANINHALIGKVPYDHLPGRLSKAFHLVDSVATLRARDALIRLARAQERSILQREADTSYSELVDITQEKGGHAVLLLALQINPHLTPEQQSCYRQLGYLVQLCDDYVDQCADRKNGITTMMHFMDEIRSSECILREATRTKLLFQSYYSGRKLQDLFSRIDRLLKRSSITQ